MSFEKLPYNFAGNTEEYEGQKIPVITFQKELDIYVNLESIYKIKNFQILRSYIDRNILILEVKDIQRNISIVNMPGNTISIIDNGDPIRYYAFYLEENVIPFKKNA